MSDEPKKRSRARMVLPPHWLDDVIRQALKAGADATGIAQAIAKNPRFVRVIEEALASEPTRDAPAVQAIRTRGYQRDAVDSLAWNGNENRGRTKGFPRDRR